MANLLFYVKTPDTTETFEDYNLGEIDGQGNWVENPTTPSTNVFVVTDSIAQAGSKCLYADYDATSIVDRLFPAEPDQVDITFYIRTNNAAGNSTRFGLADTNSDDGNKQGPHIRINANDLQHYNGSIWADITNSNVISNNIWYKIRIVADLSSDNFMLYFNDAQQGGTHIFRVNQTQFDRFYLNCSGGAGGADIYIDTIDLILGI
jgi:hypothetical protein